MTTPLPTLLDTIDVAHWLGLTVRKAEHLARAGVIPCRVAPDGHLVFDSEELREWSRNLPRPEGRRDAG